jgi:hypothetical protein
MVVVAHVVPDQPAKMLLIQRDHMVEDLAAATSYPALCCAIGEGRQLHGIVTVPIPTLRSPILIIRGEARSSDW